MSSEKKILKSHVKAPKFVSDVQDLFGKAKEYSWVCPAGGNCTCESQPWLSFNHEHSQLSEKFCFLPPDLKNRPVGSAFLKPIPYTFW